MSQAGGINNSGGGGGTVTSILGANGISASPVVAGVVTVSGINATTTTVGVASFNVAEFTVNGAGSVSLIGGSAAIDSVGVDAFSGTGTNPVLPNAAGLITVTGAQVAGGTIGANVLRTDSTIANTYTIEIQRSGVDNIPNSTLNGVSHFDSSRFSVDANGFVTLNSTGALETLTGNSGGARSPTAGNINTFGTGSITIAGVGSTLTTQLTGLTLNAIQVGAGTATLTQLGPVNSAILTTTSAGVPQLLHLNDGNIIIGSTAGQPAVSTLTPGAGISITNGSNSITIAGTGSGGFFWQTITASQTLVKFNGYMCISAGGALALALPSTISSTIGDTIIVTLDGSTSWSITQAASQQIRISSLQTTAGVTGSVTTTAQGDSITLVYQATGRWNAYQFTGNLTVV